MNIDKTKYLCIGNDNINLKIDDSTEIGGCDEYKYQGVIFEKSGMDDREVSARIMGAKKAIGCLNSIFWSKEIGKKGDIIYTRQ